MARLALTPKSLPLKYPVLPITANALDFAFTPAGADFADGASFPMTEKEILIVHNANAGVQTVTITSVIDPYSRTGNITSYSLGIGEYAVFPQFQKAGWVQSDGTLWFAASATDVEFAVLRLVD
jgi:hypothetical protein